MPAPFLLQVLQFSTGPDLSIIKIKTKPERPRNHFISVWSVWSVVENYLLQVEKKRPRTTLITRKGGVVKSRDMNKR